MKADDVRDRIIDINPKFLIIGDGCKDLYHYGHVNRLSPEAPVPVFDSEYVTVKYGMAYNVYENLIKIVMSDVDTFISMRENKNRYIDIKTNQQMLRVDEKTYSDGGLREIDRAIAHLERFKYNAVIVSDYNKGTLSYDDITEIIDICNQKKVPVFIDTKKPDLQEFEGAFIKINETEYKNKNSRASKMIVTRAENDVMYFPTTEESIHSSYPVEKKKFRDVTGAGDTFLSAVACMYALTHDINTSIKFAIKASQVSILHYGCYAPTLEEICDSKEE